MPRKFGLLAGDCAPRKVRMPARDPNFRAVMLRVGHSADVALATRWPGYHHVSRELGGPISILVSGDTSVPRRAARAFPALFLPDFAVTTWACFRFRSIRTTPPRRRRAAVFFCFRAMKLRSRRPSPRLPLGYGARTNPLPTFETGNGRDCAVASSLFQRFIPRKVELVSAHRAAHPATWGVAMLVPLLVP
jgi:hypothetical protein